MDLLTWILQILILTLGIYLFLRFLRTTQGNRIVRGLAFALPVVVILIWGTAYSLQLEELRHILKGMAGFAVVFIAILFQDELRRGMAQFGENPLVRRFVPSTDTDVLEEISRAAVDMATKQETHGSFTRIRPYGALIAFERENSLQSYIDGGRRIEARVSHELLETIFRPKSPLHDGAVIIRKDRVAAASCMLPLTQNLSIAKSTGTRHRAAIGLSEETDSIVLVVSEETGRISIAAAGKLRGVAQGDLVDELRASLGAEKDPQRESFGLRVKRFFKEDLVWFAMSVALAVMMLVIAHQDISLSRNFTVRLVDARELTTAGPGAGEIAIQLPGDEWRVKEPRPGHRFSIIAQGSRAQIDQLGANLSGTFTLDKVSDDKEPSVEIGRIAWRKTPPALLELNWKEGDTPRIVLERYTQLEIDLLPTMVAIDASQLDPHFELAKEDVDFTVGTATVVGPESAIAELEAGKITINLGTVTLSREDHRDRAFLLRLPGPLVKRGFSLAGDVPIEVTVPIRPATTSLPIEREVALTGFNAADLARLQNWSLPANALKATFTIETSGLLPTDIGTAVWKETRQKIRDYVKENLYAYVDIADQPEDQEPRTLPIRYFLRDDDWRSALGVDESMERTNLVIGSDNEPIYLIHKAPPTGD
jgi:diadenylate cyclase